MEEPLLKKNVNERGRISLHEPSWHSEKLPRGRRFLTFAKQSNISLEYEIRGASSQRLVKSNQSSKFSCSSGLRFDIFLFSQPGRAHERSSHRPLLVSRRLLLRLLQEKVEEEADLVLRLSQGLKNRQPHACGLDIHLSNTSSMYISSALLVPKEEESGIRYYQMHVS